MKLQSLADHSIICLSCSTRQEIPFYIYWNPSIDGCYKPLVMILYDNDLQYNIIWQRVILVYIVDDDDMYLYLHLYNMCINKDSKIETNHRRWPSLCFRSSFILTRCKWTSSLSVPFSHHWEQPQRESHGVGHWKCWSWWRMKRCKLKMWSCLKHMETKGISRDSLASFHKSNGQDCSDLYQSSCLQWCPELHEDGMEATTSATGTHGIARGVARILDKNLQKSNCCVGWRFFGQGF